MLATKRVPKKPTCLGFNPLHNKQAFSIQRDDISPGKTKIPAELEREQKKSAEVTAREHKEFDKRRNKKGWCAAGSCTWAAGATPGPVWVASGRSIGTAGNLRETIGWAASNDVTAVFFWCLCSGVVMATELEAGWLARSPVLSSLSLALAARRGLLLLAVCAARALAFCTTRVSGIMRWLLTSRSSSWLPAPNRAAGRGPAPLAHSQSHSAGLFFEQSALAIFPVWMSPAGPRGKKLCAFD